MPVEDMKIAIVVLDLRIGGKEQCVVDLSNALADVGCPPVLICLDEVRHLGSKIKGKGIKVIEMNKGAGNNWLLPFRLSRILVQEKIDVVHSHNWGTMMESVIASKMAGVSKMIHTQHGMDYGLEATRTHPRSRIRGLAKRITARGITRLVAVSEEIKQMMVQEWRVSSHRVCVIHNGVPINGVGVDVHQRELLRGQLGWQREEFVIGSVGVFRPVKDFPTLVEAFSQVAKEFPKARLVLIGDGHCRNEIENTISRYHLETSVSLLGSRLDATQLLPAMDLFVLPSLSEGISISILEAMSSHLPIVATRVGGNLEIIKDDCSGLMVEPGSPSQLAEAMMRMIRDSGLRERMAQNAFQQVKARYSAERMARDYQQVYAGF